MSHFTVLVVTAGLATAASLRKALAPFHEFECTGRNDEFVKEIDQTEELRKKWVEDTIDMMKGPDGQMLPTYDNMFYRDPTPEETELIGPGAGTGCGHGLIWTSKDWNDGKGYRTKVSYTPEGWTRVQVKQSDTQTFEQFVTDYHGIAAVPFGQEPDIGPVETGIGGKEHPHRYGYALLDKDGKVVKVVRRTNPRAKWDWYVVGGRWKGSLRVKPGTPADRVGEGVPGTFGNKGPEGGVDACLVGDLDMEGMRLANVKKRHQWIDNALVKVREKFPHLAPPDIFNIWKRRAEELAKARAEYEKLGVKKEGQKYPSYPMDLYEFLRQPGVFQDKFTKEEHDIAREFYWTSGVPDNEPDPRGWAERAEALCTHAVLKDGTWYEKGQMGWWGMVRDEKDTNKWQEEFTKLLQSLPPDAGICVVDCHI